MIHPLTELRHISDEKGYGLVAKQFIPKGTITWVQDKLDIILNKEALNKLGDEYTNIIDTYTFRDNKGNYILCWDNGKFMNHSFNSNCLTTAYNFEIVIRDISAGEELTDDYGYLNISVPFEGIIEESERKVVYPDDLLSYHQEWDAKTASSFPLISDVSQPLDLFLSPETKAKIQLSFYHSAFHNQLLFRP
ncbi:MAG: hypothetical protein ACI8ZM_004164 [Crocinitomix sp.]|jgi:hypothetical protein